MEKEQLQSVYDILSQYRREYYGSCDSAQSQIIKRVQSFGETLPDDLYLKLNQGSASGLFRPAFFCGDIDRSLSILEKELYLENSY